MKRMWQIALLIGASLLTASVAFASTVQNDPYLWLEEVDSEKALNWAKQQNKRSTGLIEADPLFKQLEKKNLEVYQSKDKIPYIVQRGDVYYNFWRDKEHVRGIYRRTTLDEYRKDNPDWETVLDFDALAKSENENWVYKGMSCFYPKEELCLIKLSRGGADATVVREFNMLGKTFVNGGFKLPEAKSSVSWIDENTLFVGTDFGEGSLTESGYPRIAKRWKRGTALSSAETVFEGSKTSVSAGAYRSFDKDGFVDIAYESTTFYTNKTYFWHKNNWQEIAKPDTATLHGYLNNQLFIELKDAWENDGKQYETSSILYAPINDVLENKADYRVLVKNTPSKTVSSLSFSKSAILVNWLEDVNSVLERFVPETDGSFKVQRVPLTENGSISVWETSEETDDFFVQYESFLQPDAFYLVDGNTLKPENLKQLPAFFDATKFKTTQYFVESKDGTKIPYFVIMPKNMTLNGKNPTLLYGYGGFEISLTPFYSATVGMDWLSQGGVYVLANIRGGGEYGPDWHQAALKKNRHKAYEDFEAVAEDLIARKITSPRHLGARGGSNGGLLMGAMLTRRPDLFNAIVSQVPLLDMLRFNKLLAGASWVGEYGSPDIKDERDYLASYSPYHNVKKNVQYPRALFTTSTRDDRVHPGHARKMVALMRAQGHDVLYYENMEGGHGGAANLKQSAYSEALVYTYLKIQLQ